MSLNRAFLVQQLQKQIFRSGMTRSQLGGLNAILDAWDKGYAGADPHWLAYMLATACFETGRTLQPVRETFASSDAQAIRRLQRSFDRGEMPWVREPYWTPDADGKSWFGRGLVQLTHKKNYAVMAEALAVDLVGHPERALSMDIAVDVMFTGMMEGLFTGRKLGDYFATGRSDWVNARRIINGLNRAKDIAALARAFYAALVSAAKADPPPSRPL